MGGLLRPNFSFFFLTNNYLNSLTNMLTRMDEFKDNKIKFLWNVMLYVSIFFLLFFILYGFKTVTSDICSSNSVNTITSSNFYNINTASNNSFKVLVPINKLQNVAHQDFCVEMSGSTQQYNIISHLGNDVYVNNDTVGLTCFNNLNVSNSEYRVLECSNCDTTNNVTLTLTKDDEIALFNEIPSLTKGLYYKIYQKEECEELYKQFTNIYFVIIGLIMFIFLIMKGVDWFGKWILGGWG